VFSLLVKANELEEMCKTTKALGSTNLDRMGTVDINTFDSDAQLKINEIIDTINNYEEPDCRDDWW
jgi:hypothetical protein